MTQNNGLSLWAILLLILPFTACQDSKPSERTETNDAEKTTTHVAIDLANFDTTISPRDDFYHYVNGNWLRNNPIPASESRWSSFNELTERNREILKKVINEAIEKDAEKGTPSQLVADFYQSGMNLEAIEAAGASPIMPSLEAIQNTERMADFLELNAKQRAEGISTIFSMYVSTDAKESDKMALYIRQGGLGLPTRAYYLEEQFADKKEAYQKHIKRMLELVQIEEAATKAERIVALETQLAKNSRTPIELRDTERNYNKKSVEETAALAPFLDLKAYLAHSSATAAEYIIVGQPEFLEGLQKMQKDFPLEDWKAYQMWHVIRAASPYLASDFDEAHFDFFERTLSGKSEQKERWKRVQEIVDSSIGDALGQLYVAEAFSPTAKARAEEMIENIREAFADHIKALTWMGDETKAKALEKLAGITYKIGYPEEWKSYEGVDILPDNYWNNIQQARKHRFNENISKIGKDVNPKEWFMTPSTVNAYYNPTSNEIVFPAGILQPPFFHEDADDAVNYGGIGAVIGHEISHGFDDQGSNFDLHGNINNWWTEEDKARFKKLSEALVAQFDGYTVLDGVPVKGQLTLGENIADLGGVAVAYDALQKAFEKKGIDGSTEKIDGLTLNQRFFVSWAQGWRANYTDEELRKRIETDPHSPTIFRVIGPLSNLEAFHNAFGVKEGDAMHNPTPVVIW
ncbi:MAG: M13 family metallopeptidase [Bernardetiaceae bacterium]|nr:M13 family metallopeptidase [Bernardetiaceae bacterium]